MLGIALMLFSSLFFMGLIALTKSRLSGRKGATLWQPLSDIIRLIRKGNVYSHTTSFVFQLGPSVYLASILCAMLIIPFDNQMPLLHFKGDFVVFTYLLALGKFFMIIAALDTGSSFEGMGANREALYSMLVEPAFFIMMGSFAFLTGYTSFYEIYTHLHFSSYFSYFLAALAVYVLAQIALVENSRLPVDDPKTHLELTMIHEVMVLDHSGFDMALVQIATALKFSIFGSLIANLLMPPSWPLWSKAAIFLAVQIVFAIGIGALESFRARYKMGRNPLYLLMLTSVSMLIFFTVLILTKNLLTPQ